MTNQKRVVSLGTPREVYYLLDRKRWADIGLLVSHPISDEALIYSRNPKDVQDDKYNYNLIYRFEVRSEHVVLMSYIKQVRGSASSLDLS